MQLKNYSSKKNPLEPIFSVFQRNVTHERLFLTTCTGKINGWDSPSLLCFSREMREP